ncbi:MAG: 2-amino-4-hydroxy-6-hydroxymethyldihydropteridinepyrophosphokinase, partial [uncultured Nocardioidaceae bacterium]
DRDAEPAHRRRRLPDRGAASAPPLRGLPGLEHRGPAREAPRGGGQPGRHPGRRGDRGVVGLRDPARRRPGGVRSVPERGGAARHDAAVPHAARPRAGRRDRLRQGALRGPQRPADPGRRPHRRRGPPGRRRHPRAAPPARPRARLRAAAVGRGRPGCRAARDGVRRGAGGAGRDRGRRTPRRPRARGPV